MLLESDIVVLAVFAFVIVLACVRVVLVVCAVVYALRQDAKKGAVLSNKAQLRRGLIPLIRTAAIALVDVSAWLARTGVVVHRLTQDSSPEDQAWLYGTVLLVAATEAGRRASTLTLSLLVALGFGVAPRSVDSRKPASPP